MRWNMFLSALVVSVGLGSQSFGFELLDAMLGYGGHGGGHGSSCCAEPEPSCCEPEPSCHEPEPSCCEAEQSCHKQHCGHGLLDGLFGHGGHKQGCCEPEPSCHEPEPSCCEPEPSCCEPEPSCHKQRHRCGLLSGLFGHHGHHKSSCDSCGGGGCDSCGGYGGAIGDAIEGDDAAPMPPAPMADPEASLRSKRRVVQAASIVRRN